MRISRIALLLGSAAACLAQSRDAMFDKLADRYYTEAVFRYAPEAGTQAGFHQYDPLLATGARSDIQAEIAALRGFETEVAGFDARGLSAFVAADRELLLSQIRGQLLGIETIRSWEKNPDVYSSGAAGAIFVIMSRNYAPAAARLKSVIARERLIPRMLQSARENLANPPRIYTEVALEQMPGIVGFFQNDVPAAFKTVDRSGAGGRIPSSQPGGDRGAAGLPDLAQERSAAALARRFPHRRRELSQEAALRRDGGYAARPAAGHRLREPAPQPGRVPARGGARSIPSARRSRFSRSSRSDHPAPDKLLDTFRDVLGGLRDFIEQHHIITIPSPVPPIVEETPPFMRALTIGVDGYARPLRERGQGRLSST